MQKLPLADASLHLPLELPEKQAGHPSLYKVKGEPDDMHLLACALWMGLHSSVTLWIQWASRLFTGSIFKWSAAPSPCSLL